MDTKREKETRTDGTVLERETTRTVSVATPKPGDVVSWTLCQVVEWLGWTNANVQTPSQGTPKQ